VQQADSATVYVPCWLLPFRACNPANARLSGQA
jgi:hypothetical protein